MDSSPVLVVCFANIFSQSATCLFTPLKVPFTEKFLMIRPADQSVFHGLFYQHLRLESQYQPQSHLDFLPSYLVAVLCFTFLFYHPFWINIFVRTVRAVSRFVFLPVDVPLFQHLFLTFIYFWPRWVFTAAGGLSLVAVSRGCSSLWCGGFSLWGLLLCSLAPGLGLSS